MFASTLVSALALVTNGVPCARIQMHRNASHVEVRAASELRDALRKMSGADVPYTISPGGEYLRTPYAAAEIVLVTEACGRSLLPKRARERLAATENPDAFVIATREDRGAGRAVCVGGKTPVAVYYGVYALLEDYLGCGFYHAGPDGTVIPKAETVGVPDEIFDFREPWIRYRRMSCWSKVVEPMPLDEMFAWQAKRTFQWWMDSASLHNRLSFPESALTFSQLANLPFNCGGEPFTTQAVPESLFAEHPEYFTLIGGRRVPGKYPARRCYSNPDVIQLCVRLGIAFSDYGGEVALRITDKTGGWCECDACRAYGQDANGVWSGENYAHRFVGDVAAGILAARPGANVSVSAYLQWRELPTRKIHADPRVKCVFAPHQRCYAHALNDPTADCNRRFDALYAGWRGLYPRNGIFDYYCYARTEYAPLEHVFAEDLKYYHACGLEHFVEDTSNGSVVETYPLNNWPLYYVFSKMIWNPDLDAAKEMEKAYRRYYGRAAGPMLKYHALRRQLWEAAPGHSFMGGPQRQGLCLRPDGAQARLEAHLAEAEARAKGDGDLESRVARDRRCFEGIWVARWNKVKDGIGRQSVVPFGFAAPSRPISVDGALDEAGWRGTAFLSGFRTAAGSAPKAITAVRAAFDAQGLLFGLEALADRRDQPGDAVKIVLVSPEGAVTRVTVTPDAPRTDCLVVRALEDRYVAEVRVPYAALGVAGVKTGDDWKVHVARRAGTGETSSLDGVPVTEPARFRRAAFGQNRVVNGFFEQADGAYVREFGSNIPKLVTNDLGRVSVKLEGNAVIYSLPLLDVPYDTAAPTRVRGAVTASGTGTVTVLIPYFTLAADGHTRIPGEILLGKFPLSPTPKGIPFEAEIPAGARPSVRVYGLDARLDSIEITK